jgi:hypothetical protein
MSQLQSSQLKSRRASVFCRLLIPGLPFIAFATCQHVSVAADDTISWVNLRSIDSTWRQRLPTGVVVRGQPGDFQLFAGVVNEMVPYDYQYALMLELTRKDANPAVSQEFLAIAPQGFAELFRLHGDRAALVSVFSRRFPTQVGGIPTEVWLAPQHFERVIAGRDSMNPRDIVGLTNGILVLCDAFEQATDKEVRSHILNALRNAFHPHLGAIGNEPFSANVCREWFYRHHSEFNVTVGDWHPGSPNTVRNLQIFQPRSARGQ